MDLWSSRGDAKNKPRRRTAACTTDRLHECLLGRDALEENGPRRRPQRRLGRRLEEVAKAVGGGYCRLQMPLRLALTVRGTVAGHRLGALEGGGGPPPLPMHPCCLGCHRNRPSQPHGHSPTTDAVRSG